MNTIMIPLSPNSKIMCLLFSSRAIKIHLDMTALASAETALKYNSEVKQETEGVVDEKVLMRLPKYKPAIDHTVD